MINITYRDGSADHDKVRKVKKHQVMSKAYAKRFQLAENREITIDLESLSRYNLGSSVSEYMSSNFVQALARGAQRRNAITHLEPINLRRSRSLESVQSRTSFKSTIRFRKNSESWVSILNSRPPPAAYARSSGVGRGPVRSS